MATPKTDPAVKRILDILNEDLPPHMGGGSGAGGMGGDLGGGRLGGAGGDLGGGMGEGPSADDMDEAPDYSSRSSVFMTVFGNTKLPPIRQRFAAIYKIKKSLDPRVYADCLENILTSLRYEPQNI